MLLNALTGFELLTKKNERYSLTPVASRFLVGESPDYIGAMMEHGDMLWNSWAQLKDVVRTGKPAVKVESMETAEIFSPILVRGWHVLNRKPVQQAAKALGAGISGDGLQVLDVVYASRRMGHRNRRG
jgi:hypothetical protein